MQVDPNHYRHTVIAEGRSHPGEGLRVSFCARLACIFLVLLLANGMMRHAAAQAPDGPRTVDLGIIVVPSRSDIEQVLKQLHAGMDFSVLAKERSVDATAVDGGYMGRMTPEQLRAEFRNALRGRKAGDLTDIVELPSGFAILKIFPKPPALTDLNPKRISSLMSTGAIRY